MEYLYYQRKINDVISKCPIEAGIEILVYNLLDKKIDMNNYSLVDINRIWKNQDIRLTTDTGIPDIAILSTDFYFKKEDTGMVYGFVEVKAAGNSLSQTNQISGHMNNVAHYIFTNGIVWKYYLKQKLNWEINLSVDKIPHSKKEIEIDKKVFDDLKEIIRSIEWNKNV